MKHDKGQRYKVGQLAEATGLTVRTLHHYDHVGLVRPPGRTSSGHRLYGGADVQRLYQVLALRQLGLSLETSADAGDIQQQHGGPSQQQMEFIKRANAAHS